jgi:hypothetical protein
MFTIPIQKTAAAAGLAITLAAASSNAATTPTAYLEYSGIVALGKSITVTRLPVVDATGAVRYVDVGISFKVDNAGGLTFASKPTAVPSPNLVTSNFVAGRYYVKVASATTEFANLTSGVGAGGATVWTLIMEKPADAAFPNQAIWQTGNPAPDVATRLATAKVPNNPNYSYGLSPVGNTYYFPTNGLLAAQQVNSNLNLVSYTYNKGDVASQVGSVVFVRCADTACSNAPK